MRWNHGTTILPRWRIPTFQFRIHRHLMTSTIIMTFKGCWSSTVLPKGSVGGGRGGTAGLGCAVPGGSTGGGGLATAPAPEASIAATGEGSISTDLRRKPLVDLWRPSTMLASSSLKH